MTLNNCTEFNGDRILVSPHTSNATTCYESTDSSELATDIYHLQAGDMQCPYCNSSAHDLEMLRQELYENENKLELAAKYGQNLLIENQELRSHVEAVNGENMAIVEEKDGRFHELRLQMDRMRGDYESRLGSLETELNYARAELDEKLAQLEKLNSEKVELKNDIINQRSSFMDTIKQRDDLEQDLKLEIVEVRNQLASTEKTIIDDRRKERSSASEKDVLNDRLEECQSKLKSVLYENTLLNNRCDLLKTQLDESQSHIEHLNTELSNLRSQREKCGPSVEMDQNVSIDCSEKSSEKSVQKRNKMFLSPGKESKSFSDFGKLRRQDEVGHVRSYEGQGATTVEVEEDDEEVEILALQGNSQDMWENYVDVIESEDEDEQDAANQYDTRQRKSWLEESSQLESFQRSDSNSTLSTSDEIEQEVMEKILSEISHIGAKTKSIIDYYSSYKNQTAGNLSKTLPDGESNRQSLQPEHPAKRTSRAELLSNDKNEEHNYWSAITSSGDSLVTSQSMMGAETLQSDNKFTSSSSFDQTVSRVNRKNFLDLVATELEKLKKLVNKTVPMESMVLESNLQEDRAVSTLTEQMDFLQNERDEALRKLKESEDKVKQLQDDLDKAIRSKEQLYHQLDELQCGDLSTYTSQTKQSTNTRSPHVSSIPSPNSGKFTRYTGKPRTNAQVSSEANNSQQSFNSRRVVSPRKSQTVGNNITNRKPDVRISPNVSSSSSGARNSGSTSDFIEADYQSGGSSIANSPMSSLPAPLVSRTVKLPLSHSSFSSHDKSQNVQYVLLGDANQTTKSVSRRFSFWR